MLYEVALPTIGDTPYKGKLKRYWAVTVKANWQIIFRFSIYRKNGRQVIPTLGPAS